MADSLLDFEDLETFIDGKLEELEAELDDDIDVSEIEDEVKDRYRQRIERFEEGLEEDITGEIQSLKTMLGEGETTEPVTDAPEDDLKMYETRGVEHAAQNGIDVKLNKQGTEEIHPEAVVIGDALGLTDKEDYDLSYQQVYQARQTLEEQEVLDGDTLIVPVPEDLAETVEERIARTTPGNNPSEEGETDTDFSYEFQDEELVIEYGDETYTVPTTFKDRPSREIQLFGHLAGVKTIPDSNLKQNGDHLSTFWWKAFNALEEEGVAEGGDVEGYNLVIDIPETLEDDLKDHLYDHRGVRQDSHTGKYIGRDADENLRVRNDSGIVLVTEYDSEPQMGHDIEYVETGEENGVTTARLV